jgi:hypothetical protein
MRRTGALRHGILHNPPPVLVWGVDGYSRLENHIAASGEPGEPGEPAKKDILSVPPLYSWRTNLSTILQYPSLEMVPSAYCQIYCTENNSSAISSQQHLSYPNIIVIYQR